MARVKITLDHKGIAELLHSPKMNDVVADAADAIAGHTRDLLAESGASQNRGRKRQSPPEVDVQRHTTDREHDTVMIHGAGAIVYQVRDNVYGKAVGLAGLRFRGPDDKPGAK